MKFLQDLNLMYLNMIPTLALSAEPADLRGAVTDLGGGSDAGGEPDIFDGVGEGGGADVDTGEGDGAPAGDDDTDHAGDGEEGSEAGDDVGDESGEEEEEEEQEGVEGEEEEEQEEVEQTEAEKKAAAEAKRNKPLTEEEKAVEKTLQEAYRENPKLKEALKQFPELRGTFFKAVEMNKVFPGGIQEANQAKEWSRDLFKIDQLYYGSGPQDINSKKEFLKFMYEESLDANGKSTGHYEALSELIAGDMLSNLDAQITAQGPQLAAAISKELKPAQVETAIEIVRRAISLLTGRQLPKGEARNAKPADLGPDTSNMSQRERQLAQQVADLRAAEDARNRESAATSENTFNASIMEKFTGSIRPELDKRMPAVVQNGSSRMQKAFVSDVLEEIRTSLSADDFFDAQLRAVARSGDRSQQHVQQLSDMLKQRALTLLPTVVRKVSADWQKSNTAATVGGKNQARKGNERPRREPAVGGSPGRLNRPSGRANSSAARQSDRSGNRSSGDYTRDANKLLGID